MADSQAGDSVDNPTVKVKSEKELKKEAAKAAKLAKFQAKQAAKEKNEAVASEVSTPM